MELWIRSQEGTLGKVLFIRPAGLALDIHFVGNYTTSEHFKTEERALEVLNEIHQRLLDLQTLEIDASCWKIIKRNINCVYEMPEE